ncbi:MAG: DUF5317 family protein [Chloroflexota bacterium]
MGSTLVVFAVLLRTSTSPGLPVVAGAVRQPARHRRANGGYMPSDPSAWQTLSRGWRPCPRGDFSNSALMGAGTALPWLADVFVLPRPIPLANVFSIGDVLIAVGIAWCVARSMRQPEASDWRRALVPATSAR